MKTRAISNTPQQIWPMRIDPRNNPNVIGQSLSAIICHFVCGLAFFVFVWLTFDNWESEFVLCQSDEFYTITRVLYRKKHQNEGTRINDAEPDANGGRDWKCIHPKETVLSICRLYHQI